MKRLVFLGVLLCPLVAGATSVPSLTEDITPTTDDLIYVVNDPAGSPADRKVTIGNLLGTAGLISAGAIPDLSATYQAADADLTDLADGSLTGSKVSAGTETAVGVLELATDAETVTGTDTARAVTPANVTARLAAPGAIGGTTPAAVGTTALNVSNGGTIGPDATTLGNTLVLRLYDNDSGPAWVNVLTGTNGNTPTLTALGAWDFSGATLPSFPTLNQSTSGNAATATALAADPADCGAGTFATTIAASGALTCAAIAATDLPTTGTWDASGLSITLGPLAVPLTLPTAADPTTDAAGESAFDTDAWAASHGTMEFFDGTASVFVVATTATDVPTNGQIPKWNTGGTITWEDDSTGAGSLGANLASTTDDILSNNGTLLIGGTGGTNNETLDFDFETTANVVAVSSPSSATLLTLGTINLAIGADPAEAGEIRLPNAGYIFSEAAPAGTDISVIGVTSAEVIEIGASGASGVTVTPAVILSGGITSIGGAADLSAQTVTLGTVAGTIDAGAATSLELPNGADPTTNAAGEVAVDSSAGAGSGVRFYGNASPGAVTLPAYQNKCATILAATASSDHLVFRLPYAITIRAAHVMQLGATNVIGHFDECDGNGANCATIDSTADITATTTNADDDGTLSNPSIDAGDYIRWHTTSVSGTNTELIVCIDYTVDQVN